MQKARRPRIKTDEGPGCGAFVGAKFKNPVFPASMVTDTIDGNKKHRVSVAKNSVRYKRALPQKPESPVL